MAFRFRFGAQGVLSFSLGLLPVLVFPSGTVHAQLSGKGTITGRITDSSGAVVPGAQVEARDLATNKKQTITTTGAGDYSFSLDPGHYEVTFSRDGFKSVTKTNVVVDALQTFAVNATLEVGSATETVTVSDAPPVLETSNATLGTTIEQAQYSALPLIQDGGGQRRATDFAQLLPGVNGQVTNGNGGTNAGIVNGSQSKGAVSAIYINGVPITSVGGEGDPRFVWTTMAVDAIDQFQVQTAGYPALYEGQGVQNYVVKRGTNQLHGAAYDYYRDTGLDTWGFQKTSDPLTGQLVKPSEHQHEYGLFLGFPIIKDKLFIFGGYEGYRYQHQVPHQPETIPTMLMRQGDFTETGLALYDPDSTTYDPTGNGGKGSYTRTGFGSVIPGSRLNPVALKMQSFLPTPIPGLITNNYIVNYKTGLSNWTTTNRIDYELNDKMNLSVVMAWGRQATTAPAGVNINSQNTNGMPAPYISSQQFTPRSKVFLLEYNYTITPRLQNQLKYGFGRYDGPGYNQDIGAAYSATALGITGLPAGQTQMSFPTVSFSGNTTINRWAGYSSNRNVANGYAVIDNVLWNVGAHSFVFGGEIAWLQYNFLNNATGVNPLQLSFSNAATAGYNGTTTAIPTTGNGYASFLLGAVNSGSFTLSSVPETGGRFRPMSPYIQDNWKVTSKLTLDLGVRWDYYPAYREVKDRFSYFDPNAINPYTGTKGALAFGGHGAGTCNCSSPVDNYYGNIGPRIGAAYQVAQSTVLRASYGVMFTHGNNVAGSASSRQGSGLEGYSVSPATAFIAPTVGQTGNSYWHLDQPYPSYTAPPTLDPGLGTYYTTATSQPSQSPTYADRRLGGRAPEYINYTFGIQQQLTKDIALTMSYVGSHGHFLAPDSNNGRGVVANQLDPQYLALGTLLSSQATAKNLAAAGASAPYATFGGVGNPNVAQALKPYPQYGGISDAFGFIGNTNFNALEIYATQRLAHHVTFMTNYTWSRSLDNSGSYRSGYDIPAAAAMDGVAHSKDKLEKSLSLGDQRHKFVLTGAYDLPFGSGALGGNHEVTRAVFGGFKLSGIFTAYSGGPVSVVMNSCNTNPSQNVCYPIINPNYTGDGRIHNAPKMTYKTIGQIPYLDSAAFARTPDYKFSTIARTAAYPSLFQPGNYKLDLSLRRAFAVPMGHLHEGTKVLLEADYFNVTNHTHFVYSQSNGVLNTWGTSTYGTKVVDTNAAYQRALQLAARLEF